MKTKLFFLLTILLFSFTVSKAQEIIDSVFHQCSFAICGEIKNISGGMIDDLGTELFMVSIQIDTIYKQNSHLNHPLLKIMWEVSNRNCGKPNMQNCIEPYLGKKWIFQLFPGHTNGAGDKLDSTRILPFNAVNNLKAIELAKVEKLCINPYKKEIKCSEHCKFCRDIDNENWKAVRRYISKSKQTELMLRGHKNVKYVLPMGTVLASLPSYGNITVGFRTKNGEVVKSLGYQLGYSRYIFHLFHFENVHWIKLRYFGDGSKYESSLLSALRNGIIWECKDTIHFPYAPAVWIPDSSYIRLWYALEQDKAYFIDGKVAPKFSKEYIGCLEKDSFVYSLCLLNLHSNLDVRIWGIQALRRLKDPRCIPYLLELATFYKDVYIQGDEIVSIYNHYLNEIIATLDELTACTTVYPFGSAQEQLRLSLGLPVWKSKIGNCF